MREFEYTIDEHFKNGLRPEESNPVNGPYLVELRNARPATLGLEPYIPVTLPYDSDQAYYINDDVVIWPFPQVFFCKKRTLVGTKERMYSVDATGKLISLFSFDSEERWDLADYGDYMVAAKDGSKVMTRAVTGGWGSSTSLPLCKTLVDLNGQLVIANLSAWGDWTGLGERHFAWSDIGSAVFSLDRKNEAGYREHDFTGPIVQVVRQGSAAILLGYNGISVIRPVVDPAPTFAYKNISSLGLYNKGAIAGDGDLEHCFLGANGDAYKIGNNFAVTRLGYKEYLAQLSNDTVVVLFDSSTGDYYFSDGVKSFLLSPSGMAEIFQRITSLEFFNGVKYGVSSDDSDSSFLAVTDRMDFGLRGRKSIECIELSCQGSGSFSAAIDWRTGPSDSFQRTSWVPVNDQGVANIKISATEFRFAFKCSSYTDAFLSSAKVRFKMEDMRSVRGIYAPPPRGQYAGQANT